jgi:hypothetical protein
MATAVDDIALQLQARIDTQQQVVNDAAHQIAHCSPDEPELLRVRISLTCGLECSHLISD